MKTYEYFIEAINKTAYLDKDRVIEHQYVEWLEYNGYTMLATGWSEVLKAGKQPMFLPYYVENEFTWFHASTEKKDESSIVTDFISHTAYHYMYTYSRTGTYFEAVNRLAIAWCLDHLHDIPLIPGE